MFFILSKVLQFVLNPITWIFILFLISLFSLKRRRKYLWAGLIVFYLFSNEFIFNEAARLWEIPPKKYEELKTYDFGIVLGGLATFDEKLNRLQGQRSFDRLLQAIELYHKGYIKKILFSGGSGSLTYPNMKEGSYVRDYLLSIGFPKEDLMVETESKNTKENADFSKALLQETGNENASLLLITSGFHQRRSVRIFNNIGLEVTPYSTDRLAGDRRWDPEFLLLPDAGILFYWEVLIHEWVGMAVYWVRGWV
jgi:uncharacterized SAM-binding protein YcdF (DUF218 family)